MNASLIITSIASPTPAMEMHAGQCKKEGVEFIVIGDKASPKDFRLEHCRFISYDEQQSLPYKLAPLLPDNHYARKNIGYLVSRHKDLIVETDDDNFPNNDFWFPRNNTMQGRTVEGNGWFNVYSRFTKSSAWPRGFPLESLVADPLPEAGMSVVRAPIQQGLVDENPDVDAVYRMTKTLPLYFDKGEPVALPDNCWCPFNSQNTSWFKEAFLLLYLPSGCSFRMTDIWRSFVAQRIGWTCGWNILFHQATAIQKRNVHSLSKDFAEEMPGYMHNAKICRLLEELDLEAGPAKISSNLLRCYTMLCDNKFLEAGEMKRVEAWIRDMTDNHSSM